MKDHLGNVRLSFKPTATTTNVTQEDFYYPFGLRINRKVEGDGIKYLYNGKEIEDKYDLYWYHYGARYYDPMIARWLSMDPADEFHSPYVYVGNDPVNLIDPDGRQANPAQVDPIGGLKLGIENFVYKAKSTFDKAIYNLCKSSVDVGIQGLDFSSDLSTYLSTTVALASYWTGGSSIILVEGLAAQSTYTEFAALGLSFIKYGFFDKNNPNWEYDIRSRSLSVGVSWASGFMFKMIPGNQKFVKEMAKDENWRRIKVFFDNLMDYTVDASKKAF